MSQQFNEPIAWINGELRPFASAGLPLWDLGLVAGASVTEMARTFRHEPFRLAKHLDRLLDSCRVLGFPVAANSEQLDKTVREVVKHNARLIGPDHDLGIVIFVTAGANATYLGSPGLRGGSTVIHTFPLPFTMWRESLVHGVRLRVPRIRQLPDDCLPVSHKIRNRLHWWLADNEAAQLEPGSKALLLDHRECVTETSTSCFFAVIDGEVLTPARHVLNSLSRNIVEELLQSCGIPFRRSDIPAADLVRVDEAFLSSTPVCLLPVSHIDGRVVSEFVPGPVFRKLQAAWSILAGVDIDAQIRGISVSRVATF